MAAKKTPAKKKKKGEEPEKENGERWLLTYSDLITLLFAFFVVLWAMSQVDPKKFDEILGLPKLNLESRVLAAVGFRSATDKAAALAKVRFPKEEVVIEVK